ncbi:hypothetical protein CVIRNUC_003295 [Coccomyxa viridis]|uniref:Uncharacterized protein n=1 Tax=Coccomyxa viridis TaxID=1274662 RepID=A0AAV1I190_9CHLO|nr:hypothetical protein CVIRNUC_003295 [Coccomyxa viridis]
MLPQVDNVDLVSLCAPPTKAASSAVHPVATAGSPMITVEPDVSRATDLARVGEADRS